MGQPRPKARPRKSGEGACAEDGPPPPSRSWQAPPDGLFDVIVPQLTSRQFVVLQLVCKDWSRSARYCLKDATPKRPDVDLGKLAILYPNLTQLNLSHVEGLSTRMLAPLRRLTALRELCLSNVALQQQQQPNTDAPQPCAAAHAQPCPGLEARAPGDSTAAAKPACPAGPASTGQLQSPVRPTTRSRARSAAAGTASPANKLPSGQASPAHAITGSAKTGQEDTVPPAAGTADSLGAAVDCTPPRRHKVARLGPENRSPGCIAPAGPNDDHPARAFEAAGAAAPSSDTTGGPSASAAGPSRPEAGPSGPTAAEAHATIQGAGSGEQGPAVVPPSPNSPPLSPASRIFGGLGDVLLRLNKLQADLCPALTADAIACLPNLTDLTLDTLVAPEALAPLGRLRCLAVKKLANPEALDRLSGLTALLVNSDSSCASEFLPVCTRLPGLQSLTFKTSSTKILQQPELLCWQGFSRLSSLDLRAPAECLKPGLPAMAELRSLRSLSLDLYCAGDEELMVTVVAPPNLDSLFVSSDRSRSGGVIDVHPNPRLRSLRIRLYWTALNLVLPEGLPEPSPLPEPLSDDLDLDRSPDADRFQIRDLPRLGGRLDSDQDPGRARAGGAGGADTANTTETVERGPTVATVGRRGRASDMDLVPPGAEGEETVGDDEGQPAGREPAGSAGRRLSRRAVAQRKSGGGGAADADAAAAAVKSPRSGSRRHVAARGGEGGSGSGADDGGERRMAVTGSPLLPITGPPFRSPAAATGLAHPGGNNSAEDDQNDVADMEERADADSGAAQRAATTAATGEGNGGEPAWSPSRGHRSRPSGAGASTLAAFETPDAERGRRMRRSDGGAAGAAATGGAASARSGGGATTPAASAGGGGSCYFGGSGVAVPEMELQELCLDACFFLLYGSLVPVLRQFPRLQSLTLDNCLALENGELGQLCELSGLREVSLSGLHLVTDGGLRALGRLPRLASLRVRGLRKLAVHAAQTYKRQKPIVRRYEEISGSFLTSLAPLSELRSLALKHLHTAGEGSLAAGLGALTQLTKLEVKDVNSMSDTVLQALTELKSLKELSVLHCEAVTSRGRDVVVEALGQRVALDFEGCSLPDITRPCALPTSSTQAQLIEDDCASSSNQPRQASCQHSNQHC